MKDSKDIYGRLADTLNERSKWLPLVLCEEFYELAGELFTPEQAEIANNMPIEPITAEELSSKISEKNVDELSNKLDEMILKCWDVREKKRLGVLWEKPKALIITKETRCLISFRVRKDIR